MKKVYSHVVQFRGTHYEFGKQQGLNLKDSLTLANREKQWKIRRPRFHIDVKETKAMFQRFAPQMWDEFQGFQDALGWTMAEVLQEFGGYRLDNHKSGCSILTGADYMVRNYDYHPKTYEGRYVLYQPTDQGYATIGPTQRITGRMDGMNEKGLALGYNFMHRLKPGDGFICNMIGRLVLENCATVDEAIDMLKDIPHRHSFSYVLLDENEETFIVETSPRKVQVRKGHMCTNHFELLTDENRKVLDDSKQRLETIEQHQNHITNVEQAFTLLNTPDHGVFSKQYKNWAGTIHTAAYLPQARQAWFALGENKHPYVFDFTKWLNGEDLRLNTLVGEVDTDLPFVHMEDNVR